jgi:hypothetical protein
MNFTVDETPAEPKHLLAKVTEMLETAPAEQQADRRAHPF